MLEFNIKTNPQFLKKDVEAKLKRVSGESIKDLNLMNNIHIDLVELNILKNNANSTPNINYILTNLSNNRVGDIKHITGGIVLYFNEDTYNSLKQQISNMGVVLKTVPKPQNEYTYSDILNSWS